MMEGADAPAEKEFDDEKGFTDAETEVSPCAKRDIEAEARPLWVSLLYFVVAGLMGIVFGFSLERGRVSLPVNIRLQFVFERFIMLKMFLAASATSMAVFAVLDLVPATKPAMSKCFSAFDCSKNRSIESVLGGTFVLGVGMTLAGACPGMVLAQVGSGVPNSLITMFGGLAGAAVYGLFDLEFTAMDKKGHFVPDDCRTLHCLLKANFSLTALAMAAVMAGGIGLLEGLVPWEKDTDQGASWTASGDVWTMIAWPPSLAGILIGLNQIPSVLLFQDSLGSSSAYQILTSLYAPLLNEGHKEPGSRFHFAHKNWNGSSWWQVIYVIGAVLGGAISALASDSFGSQEGITGVMAFFGGFLMLFGSRVARGCTSGHGVSGMGLLEVLSIGGAGSMFAGAIITGFIVQAAGGMNSSTLVTGAYLQ